MSSKQQLALVLASMVCIFVGLLSGESIGWILLPVWALTIFSMQKFLSQNPFHIQVIDMALLTVGLAEIVLYFLSTYPPNSIRFSLICLTYILLWFYLRQWIITSNQKQLIMGVLSATGGVLAIFTLFFFAFYWVKINDLGFGDITQFRYLYRPMGMVSNDWASIMLAFLPFSIASWFSLLRPYNRLAAAACGLISLAVIVSFSRGAIFCLVFLYVLTITLLLYYRIDRKSVV